MALLIAIPINDLAQVHLNTLLLIGIACRINSKGRGTRSISIGILFLLFPPRVFLLLLPSFVGSLGILSLIAKQEAV